MFEFIKRLFIKKPKVNENPFTLTSKRKLTKEERRSIVEEIKRDFRKTGQFNARIYQFPGDKNGRKKTK